MYESEGFLDGIEGIKSLANDIEAILDSYAVDIDGVGTHGYLMSSEDAAKVTQMMERLTLSVDRINNHWLKL